MVQLTLPPGATRYSRRRSPCPAQAFEKMPRHDAVQGACPHHGTDAVADATSACRRFVQAAQPKICSSTVAARDSSSCASQYWTSNPSSIAARQIDRLHDSSPVKQSRNFPRARWRMTRTLASDKPSSRD